jgi:hypothetical protein
MVADLDEKALLLQALLHEAGDAGFILDDEYFHDAGNVADPPPGGRPPKMTVLSSGRRGSCHLRALS